MKLKLLYTFLLIGIPGLLLSIPKGEVLPINMEGDSTNPIQNSVAKAVVLIYLASDCPISNRYAPLVNRIIERYSSRNIEFYGVYPMSSETVEGIKTHQIDYEYQVPALMDKDHFLVNQTDAMVTPETAVYLPRSDGKGSWVYRGRINDLYVDFGKWRRNPNSNDLTDTLDAILNGETPEPRKTRAIGCYIKE